METKRCWIEENKDSLDATTESQDEDVGEGMSRQVADAQCKKKGVSHAR